MVDVVALIPQTKGYSLWSKSFMKDNENREKFCDDSKTIAQECTKVMLVRAGVF